MPSLYLGATHSLKGSFSQWESKYKFFEILFSNASLQDKDFLMGLLIYLRNKVFQR